MMMAAGGHTARGTLQQLLYLLTSGRGGGTQKQKLRAAEWIEICRATTSSPRHQGHSLFPIHNEGEAPSGRRQPHELPRSSPSSSLSLCVQCVWVPSPPRTCTPYYSLLCYGSVVGLLDLGLLSPLSLPPVRSATVIPFLCRDDGDTASLNISYSIRWGCSRSACLPVCLSVSASWLGADKTQAAAAVWEEGPSISIMA